MKHLFFILITAFCLNIIAQDNNFKIIGEFSNLKEMDSVYLQTYGQTGMQTIASTTITEGKFSLEGYLKYEDSHYVTVKKNNASQEESIIGKLFVEHGETKYIGVFGRYPIYTTLEGKYLSAIYGYQKDPEYLAARDEMMRYEGRTLNDEEKVAMQKLQMPLHMFTGNVDYKWYPESHPKHQIHLADQYYFDKEFDKFQKQADHVIATYPDHPGAQRMKVVKMMRKQQEEREAKGIVKKSRVGTEYTDVSAKGINGKTYKMSEILKDNKLVLLDFWASWCGPCRAEFPHLRLAYKAYNDKGFEIFAVSLDESEEKWLKALNEEKTTWINAADLTAFKSKAVEDYGIRGIPYNILVNSKGEILGESLRGEALEEMLEKYLH